MTWDEWKFAHPAQQTAKIKAMRGNTQKEWHIDVAASSVSSKS
jgi:hypothetical protein